MELNGSAGQYFSLEARTALVTALCSRGPASALIRELSAEPSTHSLKGGAASSPCAILRSVSTTNARSTE